MGSFLIIRNDLFFTPNAYFTGILEWVVTSICCEDLDWECVFLNLSLGKRPFPEHLLYINEKTPGWLARRLGVTIKGVVDDILICV